MKHSIHSTEIAASDPSYRLQYDPRRTHAYLTEARRLQAECIRGLFASLITAPIRALHNLSSRFPGHGHVASR